MQLHYKYYYSGKTYRKSISVKVKSDITDIISKLVNAKFVRLVRPDGEVVSLIDNGITDIKTHNRMDRIVAWCNDLSITKAQVFVDGDEDD